MVPKKQIHLNFFEMSCASAHMGLGMWKIPGDFQQKKDTVEYYTWLAKLAEKGKITGIFFADVYGVDDTFPGQFEAQFRSGSNCAQMDPIIFVSAMAAATKSVCFGITGSTSYINPFILARTYSSLDHATKGRIAWNVVTSYSTSSAKANGLDKITAHDKRYEKAHEYLNLCYSLWEGSWEDGAKLFDPKRGAYDPSKIHKINFKGKHHTTSAIGASHPSPQRTPVLFQAGASPAGKAFAAQNAEAVFIGGGKPADVIDYVKEMRAEAASHGRDPQHIKIFPQLTPILGRTLEEAQAKYEKYRAAADWEGGMAKLSQYLNIDLFSYPLDEEFDVHSVGKSDNSIHAIIQMLGRYEGQGLTPRIMGEKMAFCGFGPMPVGTPDMIADVMEDWINNGDIDGFNMAYVSNPESYEDIVELLCPVLQKRGIMWSDYTVPGGTYRENMLHTPGQKLAPKGHPAASFRYEELKKRYEVDENGDITIDLRDPEVKAEVEVEAVANGNKKRRLSASAEDKKTAAVPQPKLVKVSA